MVAMPRRSACKGLERVVASPSQVIVPASGAWTPESTLISVDFPAPFWPSRQCTSPTRTSRSTPASARTPGNSLTMPLTASSAPLCSDPIGHLSPAGDPRHTVHCTLGPQRYGFQDLQALECPQLVKLSPPTCERRAYGRSSTA